MTKVIKKYKKHKLKIAFLTYPGLDKFIEDIAEKLTSMYIVKIGYINKHSDIDYWLKWADIIWFERCNELVSYASKSEKSIKTKIICRVYKEDIFTVYPKKVNWDNINKLLFLGEDTKYLFEKNFTNMKYKTEKEITKNYFDLSNIKFNNKIKGYKVAYMGFIRNSQSPELLLQIINKLVSINSNYELHLAAKFENYTLKLYWDYQIRKMNLENNVFFVKYNEHIEKLNFESNIYYDGWDIDLNEWFKDKTYIILTSIKENFGYSIIEGMSRGLKPVIHNFYSAENFWDEKHLFDSIDEAVDMIISEKVNSKQYYNFVNKNYSIKKNFGDIKQIINDVKEDENFKNIGKINFKLDKKNRPDFLIIGAGKSGTTSLFNYIKNYGKNFIAPLRKELYFFTTNYYKGINWYKKFFKPKLYFNDVTGEGTPSYLFFPHAPQRVAENLPDVKLIVLLRNPIDRAYSHYNFVKYTNKTRATEPFSFEKAIKMEQKRIEKDLNKVINGKMTYNYKYYTYLTQGLYYQHLKRWLKYFSHDKFLIIESEEFFNRTKLVIDKVFDFLDLRYKDKNKLNFRKYNQNNYKELTKETRKNLRNFFEPYNLKLYKLLNRNFDWK